MSFQLQQMRTPYYTYPQYVHLPASTICRPLLLLHIVLTLVVHPPICDYQLSYMLSGKSETTSPCNNGDPNGPKKGFACPHMMMFSTDMELAAKYDGLDQDFIYAVAGRNSDSDCGKCYQVGYKRRTKKRSCATAFCFSLDCKCSARILS